PSRRTTLSATRKTSRTASAQTVVGSSSIATTATPSSQSRPTFSIRPGVVAGETTTELIPPSCTHRTAATPRVISGQGLGREASRVVSNAAMKPLALLGLAAATAATTTLPATWSTREKAAARVVSANGLAAHVQFLADHLLEG